MTMTPENAQEMLYRMTLEALAAETSEFAMPLLVMAEQAAEITRLRAKIDAADKLAEAATPYVSIVQNGDYARQLRQHDALVAALAAYRDAGK